LLLNILSGLSRRTLVIRNFRDSEDAAPAKDIKEEVISTVTSTTTELADKIVAYWEQSEDKPTLIGIGAGSLLALYVANSVVSAVDHLPVFAGLFELIGIAFSAWTAYRFLFVPGEKEAMVGGAKTLVAKVGIKL
jgi:hypothetical protein